MTKGRRLELILPLPRAVKVVCVELLPEAFTVKSRETMQMQPGSVHCQIESPPTGDENAPFLDDPL